MSFQIEDRVRVTGRNTIGIVRNIIRTPPPRWQEDGVEQISYNVFFPTIGTQSNFHEEELTIEENPLI
jgi:hypothetical protein